MIFFTAKPKNHGKNKACGHKKTPMSTMKLLFRWTTSWTQTSKHLQRRKKLQSPRSAFDDVSWSLINVERDKKTEKVISALLVCVPMSAWLRYRHYHYGRPKRQLWFLPSFFLLTVALWNRADHYIFILWFVSFSSSSSPSIFLFLA